MPISQPLCDMKSSHQLHSLTAPLPPRKGYCACPLPTFVNNPRHQVGQPMPALKKVFEDTLSQVTSLHRSGEFCWLFWHRSSSKQSEGPDHDPDLLCPSGFLERSWWERHTYTTGPLADIFRTVVGVANAVGPPYHRIELKPVLILVGNATLMVGSLSERTQYASKLSKNYSVM